MIATLESSLLDQWYQQLGGRRRRDHPRSLAALDSLVSGPVVEGLIEIEKLTIIIYCVTSRSTRGNAPSGWPGLAAGRSPGAPSGEDRNRAGSSRTCGSSPSPADAACGFVHTHCRRWTG
jgi:hypothetical protein